jgi:hypothetical protein
MSKTIVTTTTISQIDLSDEAAKTLLSWGTDPDCPTTSIPTTMKEACCEIQDVLCRCLMQTGNTEKQISECLQNIMFIKDEIVPFINGVKGGKK